MTAMELVTIILVAIGLVTIGVGVGSFLLRAWFCFESIERIEEMLEAQKKRGKK